MATPVLPKPQPTPDDTLTEIRDILGEDSSTQKKKDKKEQRYKKQQLDVSKRAEEHFAWFGQRYDEENSGKKAKIKEKLSEGWNRVFKGRWFERVSGFLKSMSLSQSAGWLELLVGLFILIKTGLMNTLFPILIDMAKTIITAIIKYLPQFIDFLVKLLTDVLPPAFEQIFNALLDSMGVGKDSPLRSIIKPLSKFLPWLIAIGITFAKLAPILSNLFTFLRPIVTGLLRFLPHIGKLLGALNPVGIVILIVGIIWTFAEEIQSAYNWLIDNTVGLIFKLFPSLAPYKDIVASIIKGVLMLTPNIYSLSKIFSNFKNLDFVDAVKQSLKDVLNVFADFAVGALSLFTDYSAEEIDKAGKALKEKISNFVDEQVDGFISNVKLFGSFISQQFTATINNMSHFGSIMKKIFKNPQKFILLVFRTLKDKIIGLTQKYFPFLIKILDKLRSGFQKLKSMFTGKGLKETLSNLGSTLLKTVSGAFAEAKSGFKNAFTSIMETFIGMFDALAYTLANTPILSKIFDKGGKISGYGAKSAEAYTKEQSYIRQYAEKTGIDEETLKKIARSEAQAQGAQQETFRQKIQQVKQASTDDRQVSILENMLKELKTGNKKEGTPSTTINDKGNPVVKQ